jgi:catechol 2,3-dioxygenase-like lactoylglutathione lyase family enzyme
MSIKITLTSVSIDDYDKALHFYTDILGFVKKRDIDLGQGLAQQLPTSEPVHKPMTPRLS